MAFGMCNAPATFQRLINSVLSGLPHCNAYLDDLIVYTTTWEEHVKSLTQVFDRLAQASLTVNLAKCEFGHATVTHLGKRVAKGQVRPVEEKVSAILNFPVPTNRKALRHFLGMAGYYRSFCRHFSTVIQPLTDLLSPKTNFAWCSEYQQAFESAKSLLSHSPVLAAPDLSRPFKLEVDASAVRALCFYKMLMGWTIQYLISPENSTNIMFAIPLLNRKLLPCFGHFSTLSYISGPARCQLWFSLTIIPSPSYRACSITTGD